MWFAHHHREPCIEGLDLDAGTGEVVLVEGASGSGKSTMLRIATGLIPRVQGGRIAGDVRIDGRPVATLRASEVPRRIGWIPQDPETCFVAGTVRAEIEGTLTNAGVPPREVGPRIDESLGEFGASDLVDRRTATLSGGEAARVALAAAVAVGPDHLVLDEPSAQLDQDATMRLADTLRALRAGGTMILLGAHAPHPFEAIADQRIDTGAGPSTAVPTTLPDPAGGPPVLHVDGAAKRWPNGAGVGPIDLDVRPGEVVAVTGPNGAGKSTLLHLCAGLLAPDEGRVRLDGRDPRELDARQLAAGVGVCYQHPAWHITQDTVLDEVRLTAQRLGRAVDVGAVLRKLGLRHLAHAHPWDLSGGQRQRLAIATAAAHEPPLLLMDEPTRGLDAANLGRFAALLAARSRMGHATVIATHHEAVANLAHRRVRVVDGLAVRRADAIAGVAR